MNNLLSLEIDSPAKGWHWLNSQSLDENCELLEASHLYTEGFWILLRGKVDALTVVKERADSLGNHLRASKLLTDTDQSVLDGVYSLSQQKVEGFLAILECRSVTRLLEASHLLVQSGHFKVVDLLNGRGQGGHCVGYFTGQNADSAAPAGEKIKKQLNLSQFEIVSPINSQLENYFLLENS